MFDFLLFLFLLLFSFCCIFLIVYKFFLSYSSFCFFFFFFFGWYFLSLLLEFSLYIFSFFYIIDFLSFFFFTFLLLKKTLTATLIFLHFPSRFSSFMSSIYSYNSPSFCTSPFSNYLAFSSFITFNFPLILHLIDIFPSVPFTSTPLFISNYYIFYPIIMIFFSLMNN